MKFATKIFVKIFLSTAFIIGGMSMITHSWILKHHLQMSIRDTKTLVALVAMQSEDDILRNDRFELFQLFKSTMKANPHIEYIFLQNQNGNLVHTFENGVPKALLDLGSKDEKRGIDIFPIENNQKELIYHLQLAMGVPTHSTLHFGISDKKIRAELAPLRNMLLLVGFFLLLTVPFGLAWYLASLVSKPVSVLRSGVKRIGNGELGYRLDLRTGDEIDQLVQDINLMAERVEKSRDGLETEISERKHAENVLAKQTELLNHILNNVPHNIYWKDTQSIYQGGNKAFAKTAELDHPEKLVGITDYDLPWKREEADFIRQCDQKVMDTKMPLYDIEGILTQKDGQERNVIASIVPLTDPTGGVYGVLGIFYDITDRKRLEETIKQTQKMEAIGTLAGGIAHDFNNILGSIMGYTELAEDEIDHDSCAYDFLQQVLKSASRAKELVRQILTFSRKSQEEKRPVKLSLIIKEEAKLLRSTLPTTIEIRQHIEGQDGMVNADITQMHQVVMNLCTNAAHAMQGRGGILDITLSSMVVSAQDLTQEHRHVSPGPYMKLTISDTGTGIDSRIIHRIFEPFFTTKDQGVGTGMGLAVVHGIVKDHNGDIQVESNLGKGTTFTVLLPLVVSASVEEDASSSLMPTGGERVLLVDDERSLLILGKKMLESLGYHVTAVNGSLEALKAYQESPDSFDVVITDHTMPHLTGYKLAKRILQIDPGACILLCTGYSDTITPESVASAGIKALLFKPVRKKQIAMSIREALGDRVVEEVDS